MKYQFVISGIIGQEYDWWTGQRGTTTRMVREFLEKHPDEEVDIAICSPGGRATKDWRSTMLSSTMVRSTHTSSV